MQSAFEWPDGQRETYLTGVLDVRGSADGDEYAVLGGELDQDVRGVRLRITYGAMLKDYDGQRPPLRVWLDLLRGEEITFYPLASEERGLLVKPDLGHDPEWLTLTQGPGRPKTLQLKSKTRVPLTAPILDLLADTLLLS